MHTAVVAARGGRWVEKVEERQGAAGSSRAAFTVPFDCEKRKRGYLAAKQPHFALLLSAKASTSMASRPAAERMRSTWSSTGMVSES